jgi:beta-N-acetylhexosaminidase
VLRVSLAAVAAVAAVVPTATSPGATASSRSVADAGEVVLGTLTRPPSRAFLARVLRGQMGGVLLLGRWPSATGVAAVTEELQRAACTRGEPLLVAVDQEGGLVRRLTWAAPWDAPAALGSSARARSEAAAAAAALRRVGIDVDFAPVADTPGSAHTFLGSRAFSRSARVNSALTTAFVQGLQAAGVAATAKHFPGLGEAGANTDKAPVVIRAKAWKLRSGLGPFRAAVAAGAKLVMISSAAYPALDPARLPAVYSAAILGLLRDDLGFDGVAVTDTLSSPAAERFSHPATRAIAAGADLLVFGNEGASEDGYADLSRDARFYPHLRARLVESAARVRALKAWLAEQGGPSCAAR